MSAADRELSQDECDQLDIDSMGFQYEHGRAVTVADLTDEQRAALVDERTAAVPDGQLDAGEPFQRLGYLEAILDLFAREVIGRETLIGLYQQYQQRCREHFGQADS